MYLEKNVNGTIIQIRLDSHGAQNDYSYMIASDIVNSLDQNNRPSESYITFDICVKSLTSEL